MVHHDTTPRLRIVLLVGSVRSPRMANPLTQWLRSELADIAWLELDVIDLAEVELPPEQVSPGGGAPSPVAHRLAAADGFLVLTPEYNHSFPASLKNAIDWHFDEWAYKPVAFVGYGAGSGGIRAVEQLRLVFPELRATTTRDAVLLSSPWEQLDRDGRFDASASTRQALAATMEELRWWADTLRAGRGQTALRSA